MAHPDCNAGVIFDGLSSKHLPSELHGLKILMKTVGAQTLQFVLLGEAFDEQGLPIWKMVEHEALEQ
jgi:hypothetical protein